MTTGSVAGQVTRFKTHLTTRLADRDARVARRVAATAKVRVAPTLARCDRTPVSAAEPRQAEAGGPAMRERPTCPARNSG